MPRAGFAAPRKVGVRGTLRQRAGVSLGTWLPATNGMIIEQQQILTTQNLAALFSGLSLDAELRPQFPRLAMECFEWLCSRLQFRTETWHARLIAVKNSAYAWRQMVFFCALASGEQQRSFLKWAEGRLAEQAPEFVQRFRPAVIGLSNAMRRASARCGNRRIDARAAISGLDE
ncbi:MAG: hypothetical protein QM811_13410 [Pirellulales bacterium]